MGYVDTLWMNTWQEVTWTGSHGSSRYWLLYPFSGFSNPACFGILYNKQYPVAAETTGAVCVHQGNVTNPKVIKDETSNWMSICLCVTM